MSTIEERVNAKALVNNDFSGSVIYIDDAVRIAKEYAEEMCKRQNVLVANELVTWTEDLSLPNQKRIHKICAGVELAQNALKLTTDKDGE